MLGAHMIKHPDSLDRIFDQYEPRYSEHGYHGIPVGEKTKRPLVKGWTKLGVAQEHREAWRRQIS